MTEKTIAISESMEARPAALFVQTASQFSSNIKVRLDNKIVNGKSIMGIISLGILDGHRLTVMAEGDDEVTAVDALEKFFVKT